MIDVVIPLGAGSTWDNNELRYALRGIEKHLKNYRDIYIVGEHPEWLRNVIHIPFQESGHASQNIMHKIKKACDHKEVSFEFMFFNDDFFLLKDIDALSYPYYKKGCLLESIPKNVGNWYQEYVLQTIEELHSRKLATFNFDGHCPIRYNKACFLEAVSTYDFNKKLTIKSVYCNMLGVEGTFMEDCKISGRMADWYLRKKIQDRHIFSIADKCLQPYPGEKESSVKVLLNELYPNKSRYEL